VTLVLDFRATGPGPWTHAFLIGVGCYDEILGRAPGLPPELAHLPQLPEAFLSVTTIADTLIRQRGDLMPPLGTVELLASDAGQQPSARYTSPHDGRSHALDQPTLAGVTQAYLDWKLRLEADPASVALFYHCGHGLLATTPLLLLQDMATNPEDPFVQAIDLDGFYVAMKARKASTQLFLADACQKIAYSILNRIAGSRGTSLAGGPVQAMHARDALRVDAAAPGQAAWAMPGRPTQFTEALKTALEGGGAEEQADGSWRITLSGIARAVSTELARAIRKGAPYQHPVPRTEGNAAVAIRRLPGPPDVPVDIECDPNVAILGADVTLEEPPGTVRRRRAPSADLVWQETVAPDTYLARASFPAPGSPYRARTVKGICVPPRKDFRLDVH
jgi:hypothetical protein